MENTENTALHECAIDLTKSATEISNKIKNQSLIIESIQSQIESNDQTFKKNQGIFSIALDRLDHDKRNILIVFLIALILLLAYIIKTY